MKRIAKKFRHVVARYSSEGEWFSHRYELTVCESHGRVSLTVIDDGSIRAMWSGGPKQMRELAKKLDAAIRRAESREPVAPAPEGSGGDQ